ncbi:MAG: YggS family pyridoxal phosphate-dependent enzyme [Phycisphaerales bacterium]
MPTLDSLKDRYLETRERIARAAERAGRDPAGIVTVAVSKYSGLDEIRELVALGHRDFGESQVQQLIQRASAVAEWTARHKLVGRSAASSAPQPVTPGVRWHMVGHLQRNKARKAVEFARLVHSVDSLRLAEELQNIGLRNDSVIEVLLQVNCSGEASKFGCAVAAAYHLAEQMESMLNLRLRGLMTMAAPTAVADDARPTFSRLRELMDDLRRGGIGTERPRGGGFDLLSMGMSSDFEAAIAEGANVLRLGSVIFGASTNPPGDIADAHAERDLNDDAEADADAADD